MENNVSAGQQRDAAVPWGVRAARGRTGSGSTRRRLSATAIGGLSSAKPAPSASM